MFYIRLKFEIINVLIKTFIPLCYLCCHLYDPVEVKCIKHDIFNFVLPPGTGNNPVVLCFGKRLT